MTPTKPTTKDTQTISSNDVEKVSTEIVPEGFNLPDTLKAPSKELLEFLREVKGGQQEQDPEAAALAIIDKILQARTVDEVWQSSKPVHARDILNLPVTIHGFQWQRSDFETGAGVYAVIDVEDSIAHSKFVVTCGGNNVIAMLYKLKLLDAFPCGVRFTEADRPTSAGYHPLWIVPDNTGQTVDADGAPF